MTGVTTRHPEEPYANNASTVPWEVLGATRAPTRLGSENGNNKALNGRHRAVSPIQGFLFLMSCSPGFRFAPPWAILFRAFSALFFIAPNT